MEESQVTIDGKTHDLPSPFLFVATQNPNQSLGTFPLPQSQLDRFFMKLELGFPSESAEKKLLMGEHLSQSRTELIQKLAPVLSPASLLALQTEVDQVKITDPIAQYILNLVRESRNGKAGDHHGLSPRAGVDLMKAAKAWAFIAGRDFVIPEDVQSIFISVTHHRFGGEEENGLSIAQALVGRVPVL
jgi:MoxR-like ATPase